MNKIFLVLFLVLIQVLSAQNIFKAIVKDEQTHEPLVGTNVYFDSLEIGGITDSNGNIEITNIPNGLYTINFSYIGYKKIQLRFDFPLNKPDKIHTIYLEALPIESQAIYVTSTRTNGVIQNVPVRVEVLGQEEVNEEITIKPGNISKLLGETSGIQIQQTSAITGNVTPRIQGLPGKYTQVLKDGFPMYSGFSSGLSLLQIPPLDLLQVEVIKGSASALYGGDAIAGIINLISKKPSDKPEWSVLVNQTHKGGRDISSFYSYRNNKIGVNFLASQSSQNAFDVNKDGFTDIPEFHQNTFNPKLFYYFNDSTIITLGISSSSENREGGDIYVIKNVPDSAHSYIEKNKTSRLITQLKFEKKYTNHNMLTFKNSINDFDRRMSGTHDNFKGKQVSTYSELSYLLKTHNHDIVSGLNFITDAFNENEKITPVSTSLDYNHHTTGFFAQDDWRISEKFILQIGFRIDNNNKYGTYFLPRFSTLYKFSDELNARLGYGTGYKIPTVFTNDEDEITYQYLKPVSSALKSETSQGINLDISYRFHMQDFIFTMNEAFFYTIINDPLIPEPDSLASGILTYENAKSALESKGFDTNIEIALDELVLFADYSYTNVRKIYDKSNPHLELTPKHKLNLTLTFEEEENWRTGIEAFYTGKQYLNGSEQSRDYWVFGFMVEKLFKNFSITGNVENISDFRQTKYEQIIEKPYSNPTFRPIYAPLDGVVANLAIELKIK